MRALRKPGAHQSLRCDAAETGDTAESGTARPDTPASRNNLADACDAAGRVRHDVEALAL